MTNDLGRSPSGSGYSPKGGAAEASPAKPSTPNAAEFTGGGLHIATVNWAMAVCTSHGVMCGYEDARRYPYVEAAHSIREQLLDALREDGGAA